MASFRIATFNCFGVPMPSLPRRLVALARELNDHGADVVCLQEVQFHRIRTTLQRLTTGFPHSVYEPFFHAPKGGLLTLSRLPIDTHEYVLYPKRGRRLSPTLADVILHKGALISRIRVAGTPIVVINTHLSANYAGNWDLSHPHARTGRDQLQRLAALVQAQPGDAVVIVGGDFNVPRQSELYYEFIAASGLHDPLAEDMRPTYRPLRGIPARYAAPLDWLLVRYPPELKLHVRSDLFLEHAVPAAGSTTYLSDHIGIEMTLSWNVTRSMLQ